MKLADYATTHPAIFWDTPKTTLGNLSDLTVLERFLNYGQWSDIQAINRAIPLRKRQELFKKIAYKPRTNLHPATISFFADYYGLNKTSSRNSVRVSN